MTYVPTDFAVGTTYDDVEADKMGLGIQQAHTFMDKFTGNQALDVTSGKVLAGDGSLITPRFLLATDIPRLVIKTISATTYTLIATDIGKQLVFTSGSPITLTVPANASVAFTAGDVIALKTRGAGQLTVSASVGGAVKSRGSAFKLAGQGSPAVLTNYGADDWDLEGDITT